jgi:hypothetical protein
MEPRRPADGGIVAQGRILKLAVLTVALALLAPAGAAQAGGGKLRIHVTPKRGVVVNENACYRAVVTRNDRPVKRAQVRFAAKAKRTDRRGIAIVCGSYPFPGVQSLHAYKGTEHDLTRVRISRGNSPTTTPGSWKRVELQLRAYPAVVAYPPPDCETKALFGDRWGWCHNAAPNYGVDSYILRGTAPVQVEWGSPTPAIDLRFWRWQGVDETPELRGTVPHESSGNFYVYRVATGDWRWRATAGSDPTKAGEPGGPFLINVSDHTSPFGTHDGYTFHTIGYVWTWVD